MRVLTSLLAGWCAWGIAFAQVDDNGTVALKALSVPFSSFASPEARASFLQDALAVKESAAQLRELAHLDSDSAPAFRERFESSLSASVRAAESLYSVRTEERRIGGVRVLEFLPKAAMPVRNRDRVLINLHGGAFVLGAHGESILESVPVAHLAGIRVLSIDYRVGPEHVFPAASVDVAAVYRELLKSYVPTHIGIYGCSAGGLLTAQAIAWFDEEGLPLPGAIGMFCAAAAGWSGGDSGTIALPLTGVSVPQEFLSAPHPQVSNMAYFKLASMSDPLVLPIRSPKLLARFPPTLLLSSTRDQAMSSVIYTHAQLTGVGVEAELHLWDGLPHAFFVNNPQWPESKEAWQLVARFFDRRLGRKSAG